MTHSLGLLERGAGLRRRAVAGVVDVNEAYLLVHGVLARAFGGRGRDLDGALTQALAVRTATVRPCLAPL